MKDKDKEMMTDFRKSDKHHRNHLTVKGWRSVFLNQHHSIRQKKHKKKHFITFYKGTDKNILTLSLMFWFGDCMTQ